MSRDQAAFAAIGELDPAFLAAYRKLEAAPRTTGALDAKTQSFIRLAVDANATHLYLPALRQDIAACFDEGATPAEIMEVLECCATLGIHALNIGVPILVEVLEQEGKRTEATTDSTIAEFGSMRMITSAPSTAATAVSAGIPPVSAKRALAASATSKPTTS